ncbi:MAG: T9SS type A sorting domain-containing protein [Bacteroidales bacterium]|nr:T9SS type A sorting domain-containing protein [Bacteroidales bacterium]
MLPKRLLLLIIIGVTILPAFAQEVLIDLSSYSVGNTRPSKCCTKQKSALALPFFDDFSQCNPLPSAERWVSSGVFSNLRYAINPPSIGVATLDAINGKGELYPELSITPMGADTLTSLPILLNYSETDRVYLSFSFQPQGLGYASSPEDSLVVEFWDDVEAEWIRVWSASFNSEAKTLTQKNLLNVLEKTVQSDTLYKTFFNGVIHINQQRFLSSNFKFRFVNYASIPANTTVPSIRYNSDHWHIDMVYLNVNREFEDTVYNDIAFYQPIRTMMRNYTSVPWSHFAEAYKPEFSDTLKLKIDYHNLGPTTWNVERFFSIVDLSGSQSEFSFSGGGSSENIYAFQNVSYTRFFDYNFTSAWPDSAKYILKSHLVTDMAPSTAHLRYNDTIASVMEFYNYYAFDDGSAEAGYGLYGKGTESGMVAMRFYNYKADTLKGVMMYFNRTVDDANLVPFKITLWDDDNGKPGNIFYQMSGVRPVHTDSLNKFTVYGIDPTFIPVGNFYLGWEKTTSDMLNVGYDRNLQNQSRLFYDYEGVWRNTEYEGSLMVRPILGKMHQPITHVGYAKDQSSITVYPNPASNYFSITSDSPVEIVSVQIISTTGRVVRNLGFLANLNGISVQDLPVGLYLVRICYAKGEPTTRKLLIAR